MAGCLFWYLQHWCPAWFAALVAIVLFGFLHMYQGWQGVMRTALIGAALFLLYWLTGSIWLSIVLYAAIDMLQGKMFFRILKNN